MEEVAFLLESNVKKSGECSSRFRFEMGIGKVSGLGSVRVMFMSSSC